MCVTSKPVQYEELELLAIVAASAVTLAVAKNEIDASNNGSYEGVKCIKHKRVNAEDAFGRLGPMHS